MEIMINTKDAKKRIKETWKREIGNKYLDDKYESIYIGNSIKYKWPKYPEESLKLSYKGN